MLDGDSPIVEWIRPIGGERWHVRYPGASRTLCGYVWIGEAINNLPGKPGRTRCAECARAVHRLSSR